MVAALARDEIDCVGQASHGITYAKKIGKAEARIDFAMPASQVRNHIHGLSPFPGAWFAAHGTRVKVLLCEAIAATGPAGTVLDERLAIACGEGAVRLLTLQREGKGPMAAAEFLRGFAIAAGTVLT